MRTSTIAPLSALALLLWMAASCATEEQAARPHRVPDAGKSVAERPVKEAVRATAELEDSEVVILRVPRTALGIQWPKERKSPDASPFAFGPQNRENILVAVADFPQRVAPMLDKVKELANKLGTNRPALPADGAGLVKFYTGSNHSLHGLITNGVTNAGEDSRIKPPAGQGYAEHHFARVGGVDRLDLIVSHSEKGERHVDESFHYDDEGRPIAHFWCHNNKFSYGDYGLWEGKKLVLVCRIVLQRVVNHTGSIYTNDEPAYGLVSKVLGYTCNIYAGDQLAYSTYYVTSKENPRDFLLHSITTADNTIMNFDDYGRLTAISIGDPRAR